MSAARVRREFAKGVLDRAIRQVLEDLPNATTKAFVHLLWNVQARSDLLRPDRFVGRTGAERPDLLVAGLLALVQHHKDWLRPVETWEPRGDHDNRLPLFSALAHHLLANYPVPAVLTSAWFRGTDWTARRLQGWFKRAGLGQSLRTARFPVRLSSRMAHEFAHAPAHFPIEFALRWAQVQGLGGSEELARVVASTRLGREFHHDEFWTSVIQWFVNQRRLDLAHVEPIVDFLHDQKFEPRRVIVGDDTEIELEPPQPDLSIRRRTVASLLRRVAEWRARKHPEQPERRLIRWPSSDIAPYRREDAAGAWTIRELLDSDELAAEGQAMNHCVATYTSWCVRRDSTIWSLGQDAPDGRRRLVTLEVNPESKAVVQAKMKDNDEPDSLCRGLVEDWARQAGLKVEY